jgi:hypothetical protein
MSQPKLETDDFLLPIFFSSQKATVETKLNDLSWSEAYFTLSKDSLALLSSK